jgi:hypothetical protein
VRFQQLLQLGTFFRVPYLSLVAQEGLEVELPRWS